MEEPHHRPPPHLPSKRPQQHLPIAINGPLFRKDKHIAYWLRCLRQPLPQQYIPNDSNRMLFAFFTVSALDLLGVLFTRTTKAERDAYIAWIYRHQHPEGGFRAFPGTDFGDLRSPLNAPWDPANIPGTYLALAALCVLRDDLNRVHRKACLSWLNRMQRPSGSFGQTLGIDGHVEGGMDTRFGYCVMVTRWILRSDMDGEVEGVPDVDVEALVRCIQGSETHDGGVCDEPFHEAHAGYTYCAIGCLYFLKNRLPLPRSAKPPQEPLDDRSKALGLADPEATLRWLLSRVTDFVEEEHQDDDTDADGDLEMLSNDGSSTANEVFQTPNTSFSSNNDYAARESPLPHSFEKIGSHVANPSEQLPLPNLLDADSVSVASSPPSEDEEGAGTVQWAGCNGRANKLADTCYAFWVGGSLSILRSLHLIDPVPIRRYLLEKTQNVIMGGFGKHTSDLPDVFHSYLGLSALSLFDIEATEPVDVSATDESAQDTHTQQMSHQPPQPPLTSDGHHSDTAANAAILHAPAMDGQHAVGGQMGTAERSFATIATVTSNPSLRPQPPHPPPSPAINLEDPGITSDPTTSPPTHTPAPSTSAVPPMKRNNGAYAINDGSADQRRVLRALDPAVCVSERTRAWIESLGWRQERERTDGGD